MILASIGKLAIDSRNNPMLHDALMLIAASTGKRNNFASQVALAKKNLFSQLEKTQKTSRDFPLIKRALEAVNNLEQKHRELVLTIRRQGQQGQDVDAAREMLEQAQSEYIAATRLLSQRTQGNPKSPGDIEASAADSMDQTKIKQILALLTKLISERMNFKVKESLETAQALLKIVDAGVSIEEDKQYKRLAAGAIRRALEVQDIPSLRALTFSP